MEAVLGAGRAPASHSADSHQRLRVALLHSQLRAVQRNWSTHPEDYKICLHPLNLLPFRLPGFTALIALQFFDVLESSCRAGSGMATTGLDFAGDQVAFAHLCWAAGHRIDKPQLPRRRRHYLAGRWR